MTTKAGAGGLALLLLCLALPASANGVLLTTQGEDAGQTSNPQGLAVDQSTAAATSGYLYIADSGNNRIDVFDEAGAFVFAFGWKVNKATPEEKFQTCTAVTGCQKGTVGSGDGQFNNPASVTVDSSTHEIYVADFGNQRIQKFSSAGGFLLKFGVGEEFKAKMVLAVGPGGIVHVADNPTIDGTPNICLRKYEATGGPPIFAKKCPVGATGVLKGGLAVDATGIYLRGFPIPQSFAKYDVNGNSIFAFPSEGAVQSGVTALGMDADGHLFAEGIDLTPLKEYQAVVEYDSSSGKALRRFGHRVFTGSSREGIAAHTSTSGGIIVGDVYVSEGQIVHRIPIPEPGPIIIGPCENLTPGKTRVKLNGEVNPEGKETTYYFEYVTHADFLVSGFATKTRFPANPANDPKLKDSDPALHRASLVIDGLSPETKYHCRIVASNADKANVVGEEGIFDTGAPFDVLGIRTSDVGPESATLQAEVNPLGNPVKGRFQYIDEKSFDAEGDFAGPSLKESAEISFGAGEEPVVGSVKISGLDPGTTYRYRLTAELANGTFPYIGEPFSLRTFAFPPEEIPDSRKYEMVSPALKSNAEVAAPTGAGGGNSIQAAAPNGEKVTFGSFTAFADPESAPGFNSQYLAKRSGVGWLTENIDLFGRILFVESSYRGFLPNLSFGAGSNFEPSLTPDCPAGFTNLYWRENATGALRCVTNKVPSVAAGERYCVAYAGASADGSRVFFAAKGSFPGTEAPKGKGFSLYQWSEAGGIELISRLPEPGEPPAAPTQLTGFGPGLGLTDDCKLNGNLHNAISTDGERVLWTYVPPIGTSRLLARLEGSETIQLDKTQSGPGSSGNGRFLAASSDGSAVFFTGPGSNPLVTDASGGVDLYRYDFDKPEGARLTDLTPDGLTPGSEGAGVSGLLGTSEDGARAYFAADGKLAAEASSGNCGAPSGTCNLYLWQEGVAGVRFITTLSGSDQSAWIDNPSGHSARVTPDGRHLAFTSILERSGYDNTIEGEPGCKLEDGELVGTDPRCAEVYLYDAEEDVLSCASCNPTGERPIGPATLPGWRNLAEGPRYLSDDGSRLFFQSYDALVLEDENKTQDVYEFERPGAGSCKEQAKAFVRASGGCLYSLSAGKNPDPSYLIDASSDGRDVFLSTRQQLLPEWDLDGRYDVYDYRIGGGFPPPPLPEDCIDLEACRPPAKSTPAFTSPATETFEAVEAKPKRRACPKGKRRVTRKGKSRCVKRQGAKRSGKQVERHDRREQR